MADNKIVSPDLVIYQDDKTGKRYYWNGKELVYLNTVTPKIGDQGDKDFQAREEEERKAQIEKERQEAQAAKDAGEEYDPEALMDDESAEEREQRINDIQDMLGDESTRATAEKEARTKVDRELAKKKAADLRNSPSSNIQRFKLSLEQFIAKEVRPRRKGTWQKPHMGYEGSGIMRKGRRYSKDEKIPKINVYFDQSGSWDEKDIAVGLEAIGVLKNYEDRGEIKVDLYYFANHVSGNNDRGEIGGGTGAGAELIEHIRATNPDNVIMMTDGDMDYGQWEEILSAPKVILPGAVWFLFRNSSSRALPEWIKGARQTYAFMI